MVIGYSGARRRRRARERKRLLDNWQVPYGPITKAEDRWDKVSFAILLAVVGLLLIVSITSIVMTFQHR